MAKDDAGHDDASDARPRLGLYIALALVAVLFGGLQVARVVGRFAESSESGWAALSVVGSAAAAVVLSVVVVVLLVVGPWIRQWRAFAKRWPHARVFLARKTATTAAELSALIGRDVLSGSRDEYFFVVLRDARLEVWIGRRSATLAAAVRTSDISHPRVEVRPLSMLGRGRAIVLSYGSRGEERELSFVVTRVDRFTAMIASREQYQAIIDHVAANQ